MPKLQITIGRCNTAHERHTAQAIGQHVQHHVKEDIAALPGLVTRALLVHNAEHAQVRPDTFGITRVMIGDRAWIMFKPLA